jgi:hypothetical protein
VHRSRLLLLIPAGFLLAAAFVVPRFLADRDDRRLPPPTSGVAISCPKLVPRNLPRGVARVATETQNLGGGVFGKSTIYSDGLREVSFHIGYEVIEKLEDLDFDQSQARIGSREVTLYDAKSLPPGAMVAADWDAEIGHPECSLVTVLARNFGHTELEQFVAGLRISNPSAGSSRS